MVEWKIVNLHQKFLDPVSVAAEHDYAFFHLLSR